MIEKEELKIFLSKYCTISLDNGFFYSGTLKKINEHSVVFDDRYDGHKVISISIITGIGQAGEKHDRHN